MGRFGGEVWPLGLLKKRKKKSLRISPADFISTFGVVRKKQTNTNRTFLEKQRG